MKESFDADNVVRMDAFRNNREDAKLQAMVSESSAAPRQETVLERKKEISIDEALLIAQDIVKKYADKQDLFNAYLKEHEKEPSLRSIEIFNILIDQKKEMVAKWNIGELMDLLQTYSENPEDTFKIHVFCAAEEILKRITTKE